jgi:hypothetical protein
MPAGNTISFPSGAVIGVRSRRRHPEVERIGRFADARARHALGELRGSKNVVEVAAASDGQALVGLPPIRIPDLAAKRRQLGECLRARLIGHPVESANAVLHRRQQELHHLLHARFSGRREHLVDIRLAEHVADHGIGAFHAGPPPRRRLVLPAEMAVVEFEHLLAELRRKVARPRPHQVPREERLPIGQCGFLKLAVELFHELQVRHIGDAFEPDPTAR